jgi:hypothetical protein
MEAAGIEPASVCNSSIFSTKSYVNNAACSAGTELVDGDTACLRVSQLDSHLQCVVFTWYQLSAKNRQTFWHLFERITGDYGSQRLCH